jgi:putative ABC transport system permease protein
MNTFAMALRNIGRNRRRSLLAMISVFLAIFVAVFADGFISGIVESMTRNVTKNQTGHVNVETSRYRSRERFMPANAAIPDAGAVAAAISGDPALRRLVDQVEPRIQFGVVLSGPAGTKPALGMGGDPEGERRLLMLDRTILPGGSYLGSPGEAIVGWKLASDLGLKPGDYLKVMTEKADYGLGFKKFRIAGLFKTGLESFDAASFQVAITDARDLLGMGAGASQVIVMLKSSREADRAAALVAKALAAAGMEVADSAGPKPGAAPNANALSVRSWTSIGDFASLIRIVSGVYAMIELIFIFLGAFIIANVMMMVVLERKREIGILKSMGMRRSRILGLFLTEGSLLGAFGSAAGAIAGTAINAFFAARGMDVSKLIGGTDYQMDNVVHTGVHPLQVLGFFLLGVLVSAAIAYLPSRGAARMDPIDAIRSV